MNVRLLGLALGLGLALPVVAQAQMLQPGLWEMTSSNVKVDDQVMDVQSILGQLQGQMTPQQRAALEKNGIGHLQIPLGLLTNLCWNVVCEAATRRGLSVNLRVRRRWMRCRCETNISA